MRCNLSFYRKWLPANQSSILNSMKAVIPPKSPLEILHPSPFLGSSLIVISTALVNLIMHDYELNTNNELTLSIVRNWGPFFFFHIIELLGILRLCIFTSEKKCRMVNIQKWPSNNISTNKNWFKERCSIVLSPIQFRGSVSLFGAVNIHLPFQQKHQAKMKNAYPAITLK